MGDRIIEPSRRYPVVRLQVLESFSGAELGDFAVRLTSDLFVDGEPKQVLEMHPGEVWLVEAYRSPTDKQWYTSSCERSKRASQTDSDLLMLRTWVAGKTPSPHFYGGVLKRSSSPYATPIPGVRIYLRGENSFSVVSDSQGRFLIENLSPGVYEVATDPPMDRGPLEIDFRKSWCAERVLMIK